MATAAHEGESGPKALGRFGRALASDFVVAIAIGILLLILKIIGLLPPIAVVVGLPAIILAYLLHGYATGKDRQPTRRERFADNLYFLGFIFTMGSLIASFLPVAFGGTPLSVEEIYPAFGTALIATALGLILRVIVVQGAADDAEPEELASSVSALSRQVASEAQAMLAELQAGRAGLAEQNRQTVETVLGRIDAEIARITTEFGSASKAAREALSAQSEELKAAADALRQKLAANTEDLTRAADSLAGARTRMSETLSELTGPVARLTEGLSDVGEGSRRAAEALQTDVRKLGRILETVAASGQRLDELLTGLEGQAQRDAARLRATLATLEGELAESQGLAPALKQDAEQFEKAMLEAIRTFSVSVGKLTEALARLGADPAAAAAGSAIRVEPEHGPEDPASQRPSAGADGAAA
ncbi:MAG: hypothetical protein SNJ63_10065 [Sphingomonadaceae bacterium]